MIRVNIKKLDPQVVLPAYSRDGDAAMDIRSAEDYLLKIGERKAFKTGLAFEIPEGYAGLVWDRGGMAAKYGIHTMAGVLDANYRGEMMIVLKNLSEEDFNITRGDRIAQMLVQKVERCAIVEVEHLSETERGAGRFGSSGIK